MINNIPKTIASMLLSFKLILCLNDNWETYQKSGIYTARKVEKREVDKMLSCMDPEKGYSVYMCAECGKTKVVHHTCKSRICTVCGKKHADEWAEKINKEMYAVPYRQIILTVSDRLWPYFEGYSELQKLMLNTAAAVLKEIVKEYNGKDKKAEPSMIMVLHPFGRDLKTNMHVHILMTEGALTPRGKWIPMPGNREIAQIIEWCFKEINIQAKRRIDGKTKQAARSWHDT